MQKQPFTLKDFDYVLPEDRIAQYPRRDRTASRLMVVNGPHIVHRNFTALALLLKQGDVLLLNDTRVIPARLLGRKTSGGTAEILIERIVSESEVLAQIRSSRSPKPGNSLYIGDVEVLVQGRQNGFFRLVFSQRVQEVLDLHGDVPLPPYIKRPSEDDDVERYQTVYADKPGAVAAPTAGLHFNREFLQGLRDKGVRVGTLTLHVGAGTFQPVRYSDLSKHKMHNEWYCISRDTREMVDNCHGRIIAVGTTVLRALESAAITGKDEGETTLFIRPGFQFKLVDALLTNFHLPKSTLLMLVAAFGGYESILKAYRLAVESGYRFFSYGDAMLVHRAI